MKSEMWFRSDELRRGFVMKFINGYKVAVEYLRQESDEVATVLPEKGVFVENIPWSVVAQVMRDSKHEEGDDVGKLFDVFVYNPNGKMIRLPKWSKRVEFLSGVSLEKVIDTLYLVRKIKTGVN